MKNDYRDYLMHYGVKGMRWRKHKRKTEDDSSKPEIHYSQGKKPQMHRPIISRPKTYKKEKGSGIHTYSGYSGRPVGSIYKYAEQMARQISKTTGRKNDQAVYDAKRISKAITSTKKKRRRAKRRVNNIIRRHRRT